MRLSRKIDLALEPVMPKEKMRIIDAVADAGLDVSAWSNGVGGDAKAASNPVFCFNWTFREADKFLFCLWYANMDIEDGTIFEKGNYRDVMRGARGLGVKRAQQVDTNLAEAFLFNCPVQVVLLHSGRGPEYVRAEQRSLDTNLWKIVHYDFETGAFRIDRTDRPADRLEQAPQNCIDDEVLSYREGQERTAFVRYKVREQRLRAAKIQAFIERHNRVYCEVPGCGFDFGEFYGEDCAGFAHVHHKFMLSEASEEGVETELDDLNVVCPNCHAMIHRGGQCRDIETLIPSAGKG